MRRIEFVAATMIAAACFPTGDANAQNADHVPSVQERCTGSGHRQFDFWIGQWNVDNRQRNPATPEDTVLYDTGTATAEIHSILDGCAIVEHWEGYLVPDRHVLGFSLRTFDPDSGRWHVLLNWPAPGAPSFFQIDGSFSDGVADFVFERPGGGFARYRFIDTTGDRPRWEGAAAETTDGPWSPFWVMQFSRRDRVFEPALHNGRARATDHCPDEKARVYDVLIGDWIGEETVFGAGSASTRPIQVRSWAILEGCALVDMVEAGEGTERTKEFRVRALVPSEDRWVQYSLERGAPDFQRWVGDGSTDTLALVRSTGERAGANGDRILERMSWQSTAEGELLREIAVSRDGGESWETAARAELRRR